jgi:hypothetical protein
MIMEAVLALVREFSGKVDFRFSAENAPDKESRARSRVFSVQRKRNAL